MTIEAPYNRRVNKYFKQDPESKAAFRDRTYITACHELPNVQHYQAAEGEIGIIAHFEKWHIFYNNKPFMNKVELYMRLRTLHIFADYQFCFNYEQSDNKKKVNYLHYEYILIIL